MSSINQPKSLLLRPPQSLFSIVEFRIIAFVLLHIPLSFLLASSAWLGTIHALIVFLYGLRAAVRREDIRLISVLGYIAGAEILWRMTGTRIYWEYGKYASTLLAFLAILFAYRVPAPLRSAQRIPRFNPAVLFYLAFLLPSLILTLGESNLAEMRNDISFNLSGPLSLTLLALYFWRRPIDKRKLIYFLIALLAPIVGILTRAGWRTLTADSLEFSLNANFVTSGGYGPNQVSVILGLGALACVILLVLLWRHTLFRLFFSGLSILFFFQAILTFSRGGVYSFVLAALLFSLHLFKSPQARNRFAFLAVMGLLFAWYIGIPFLDEITASAWQARFTSLDTTGRVDLAIADWQAFLEHPLVGLGVGLSKQFHDASLDRAIAAHTEFSRILAEHGLLGVLSTLILFALILSSYLHAKPGIGRALVATFAVWSLSIMVHSGMRIVAISLGVSLALALWQVSLADDTSWEEM